jgi:GNAT superfamily N-acetyltransferase
MPGGPTAQWDAWLNRVSAWFAVERLTRDREDELAGFFKASYRDQPLSDQFLDDTLVRRRVRWITEGNPVPLDGGLPAWICLQHNRIVGHFGALAADAVAGGDVMPMCWGRDLIVAPEARRLGAGPLLVMTAVRAAARPFMVAGLNDDSYSLCHGLGFRDSGKLPLYVKVHDAKRLMETTGSPMLGGRAAAALVATAQTLSNRPRRRTRPVAVTPLERFDEEFDRWWAGVEPAFGCVVRRTSRTLAWRYLDHPSHGYRCFAARDGHSLRGVVVVRVGQSRGLPAGFISEVLADPGDRAALDSLIAHATAFFASPDRETPVFVRCAVLHPAFERVLRRAGFLRVPSPIRWMMIHPAGAAALGPLVERERWMLSAGDSDLDMV